MPSNIRLKYMRSWGRGESEEVEVKKCKDCDSELQESPPIEEWLACKLFKIPFTNLKILLVNDKPEYTCIECSTANENYWRDREYDAIYNTGFQKGYEDGVNERY